MDTVDVLIIIAASVGALALVVAICYFCDARARANFFRLCGCGRRDGDGDGDGDAAPRYGALAHCFKCFDCSLLCYRTAYCADPCGIPYRKISGLESKLDDAQALLEPAYESAPPSLAMDARSPQTLPPPLSLLHV
jgi:hypothetical protein